jgi:hypothetical protein
MSLMKPLAFSSGAGPARLLRRLSFCLYKTSNFGANQEANTQAKEVQSSYGSTKKPNIGICCATILPEYTVHKEIRKTVFANVGLSGPESSEQDLFTPNKHLPLVHENGT